MNTKNALWIFIGLLFIGALFLTFKAGSIENTISVAQTATSTVKSASSGMVGGC